MQAMLADDEFKAEAGRRRLRLIPLTGAELQSALESTIGNADSATLDRARRMVEN